MSISLAALLSIASAISSAYGSSEDDKAARKYTEKEKAYQRERERIAESNRLRNERMQRRREMGAAVGSDLKLLSPRDTPVPSGTSNYKIPEKSAWTDIGGALGVAGSLAGDLNMDSLSDAPIVGSLVSSYQNPLEGPPAPPVYNPNLYGRDPTSSYGFEERYDPKKYLTK